LATPASHL